MARILMLRITQQKECGGDAYAPDAPLVRLSTSFTLDT